MTIRLGNYLHWCLKLRDPNTLARYIVWRDKWLLFEDAEVASSDELRSPTQIASRTPKIGIALEMEFLES